MNATEKQINFIYSLEGQLGEELAARVTFDTIPNFKGIDFLTKAGASKLISALIDVRDHGYEDEEDDFIYSEDQMNAMFAALDC